MPKLLHLARLLFSLSIAAFGILYLLYGNFVSGLPPIPSWTPGGQPAAVAVAISLLLLAGALLSRRLRAPAATLLGLFYLLATLLLYGTRLPAILRDGGVRTGAFEALALSGVALVLASLNARHRQTRNQTRSRSRSRRPGTSLTANLGLGLVAVSMAVFAGLHLQYAAFVATLIPAWIPWHLFWTWFTAAVFLSGAVAVLLPRLRSLAGAGLALMLLSWVVLLHAPRVAAAPHNLDEWTSLFVALALGSGCFFIAALPHPRPSDAPAPLL